MVIVVRHLFGLLFFFDFPGTARFLIPFHVGHDIFAIVVELFGRLDQRLFALHGPAVDRGDLGLKLAISELDAEHLFLLIYKLVHRVNGLGCRLLRSVVARLHWWRFRANS